MTKARQTLLWIAVVAASVAATIAAAFSPLFAWRDPIYVAASFAGIAALILLLFQTLTAQGSIMNLHPMRSRKLHAWSGALLLLAIVAHVGALYVTSPLDVIDVLLFRAPTGYSFWGLAAMWAVLITAPIALFRRKLKWRPRSWRRVHLFLATVAISGTVMHTILIQGAMETVTKLVLCAVVVIASGVVFARTKLV